MPLSWERAATFTCRPDSSADSRTNVENAPRISCESLAPDFFLEVVLDVGVERRPGRVGRLQLDTWQPAKRQSVFEAPRGKRPLRLPALPRRLRSQRARPVEGRAAVFLPPADRMQAEDMAAAGQEIRRLATQPSSRTAREEELEPGLRTVVGRLNLVQQLRHLLDFVHDDVSDAGRQRRQLPAERGRVGFEPPPECRVIEPVEHRRVGRNRVVEELRLPRLPGAQEKTDLVPGHVRVEPVEQRPVAEHGHVDYTVFSTCRC